MADRPVCEEHHQQTVQVLERAVVPAAPMAAVALRALGVDAAPAQTAVDAVIDRRLLEVHGPRRRLVEALPHELPVRGLYRLPREAVDRDRDRVTRPSTGSNGSRTRSNRCY